MAKRILLVEDEPDVAAVTKARLENAGYVVLVVGTGEDALACARKDAPDLILLDLLLPKMRGEEVCKEVKGSSALRRVPVILFTASASDMPKLTEDLGADDYIMKPFEHEELLGKIRKFIGGEAIG